MATLHYLTIQDMLWINHRVTGKVNSFRYDALEEGTFYQYGYGKSVELESQAARFLVGFANLAPFAEGNEKTAFVGFVAFLRVNGKDLEIAEKDAVDWAAGRVEEAAVAGKIVPGHDLHGDVDMEELIEKVVLDFASVLAAPVPA